MCPVRFQAKEAVNNIMPTDGLYFCPVCNEGFDCQATSTPKALFQGCCPLLESNDEAQLYWRIQNCR